MSLTVEVDASAFSGALCKLGLVQPLVPSDEVALVRHHENVCRDLIEVCAALDEQADVYGLPSDYEQLVWRHHRPATGLPIEWLAEHRTTDHDVACEICREAVSIDGLVDVYPRDNLLDFAHDITERTSMYSDCRERAGYEPVAPTATCPWWEGEYAMSEGKFVGCDHRNRENRVWS